MKTVDTFAIIHAIQISTSIGTNIVVVAAISPTSAELKMVKIFVISPVLVPTIYTGTAHVFQRAHLLSNTDPLKAKNTAILHAQTSLYMLIGMAHVKQTVLSHSFKSLKRTETIVFTPV